MNTIKISLIFYIILLAATPTTGALADNKDFNPYTLPPDKTVLNACQQSALAEVPGEIINFLIIDKPKGFIYQFEIKAKDQSLSLVVCDGSTRKIIRIRRLE